MGTDKGLAMLVQRGSDVPGSPLVSICIPVLSDATLVLGCLDSLTEGSRWNECEAIVVANGMSEAARRVLEERDDIVLVRSGTNLGFAGGNNLAAAFARGRYLLFLNDDSTVATDCIAQLLATADQGPDDRGGGVPDPLGRRFAARGGISAVERRFDGTRRSRPPGRHPPILLRA